jgi:hypothetical protein
VIKDQVRLQDAPDADDAFEQTQFFDLAGEADAASKKRVSTRVSHFVKPQESIRQGPLQGLLFE